MCNRHTGSVWEDAAPEGGWVTVGNSQWHSTVNSFKDGYNGFFLFDAFYFN